MARYSAVYDSLEQARDAVDDLIDHGYLAENISIVAYDVNEEYAPYLEDTYDTRYAAETGTAAASADEVLITDPADDVAEGAGIGAMIGGLGGMLIGLTALTIPGLGPVIAAGPIAATLAGGALGAAGGAATGALVEVLVDLGVERPRAEYYAQGIERGGAMVTVETAVVDPAANEILERHRPVDIERDAEM